MKTMRAHLTTIIHSIMTQLRWRQISLAVSIVLVLFTTFVPAGSAVLAASPKHGTSTTAPYKGTPNLYQPQTKSVADTQVHDGNLPQPAVHAPKGATSTAATTKPFAAAMQPMRLTLSATQPSQATSSDGLLTVRVPAGAMSTADVAAAGGAAILNVLEVSPGSGSTNGGIISLGTYLLQVQDTKGNEFVASHGFQHPLSLTYHYPLKHSPVALSSFKLVVNGAHPVVLPIVAKQFGKPQTLAVQADTTTNTMTAQVQPLTASTSGSFDTDSPQGWFGKADATNVSLQTGDLQYGVPLDIPTGPGGLTPPLTLSYSSNAISQTHNTQAAAPWVGQGWNLNLGEITWSESNYSANSGTATWQSTWTLSDASGASMALIPPSTCFSTYYDDSSCTQPSPPAVSNWNTTPESHIRVISYTNPTVDCTNFPQTNVCGQGNYGQQPPCFRVWQQSGLMEEFGCTTDSRQWYPGSTSGTENLMSAWLLDLIVDPNGNQIHITYDQDMATSNGVSYPRDVVMSSIGWNSPTCHNANTACTGPSAPNHWGPLYSVNFSHSATVAHIYPGAPHCGPSNGLRCDDPVAQTSPNIGTPLLTQTQVLNDATVQVFANGQWNTLRSYQFSYGQAALNPNLITDPVTGNNESVAGYLTLDKVQELGTDTLTGFPPLTFGYSVSSQQYYEDSQHYPATDDWDPTVHGECGGQWNVTGGMQTWNWGNNVGNNNIGYPSSCTLFSRTYALFLMSDLDNGQGMHESFNWVNLRTNQHGVPSGYNAQDPTVCTTLESTIAGTQMPLACRYPDDNGWSHMGLASRSETVGTPTSANPNAVQTRTWSYSYRLTALTAQECSNCTVGMYWGDANDGDYLDYYNGRFAGFAFAQVNNPDGSQEADSFYTTEGWGLYSSSLACHDGQTTCPQSRWWDTNNAATGRPSEVDIYDVPHNGTNALLQKTLTTYTVTCPPGSVSGDTSYGQRAANLDPDNPLVDCDVLTNTVKTYAANGVSNPTDTTAPMSQTAYAYGSYAYPTTQTTTGNDLSGTPTIVHQSDVIFDDNIQTSTMPPTGTFLVLTADSLMQNSSGNIAACTLNDYDGHSFATGSQGGLTKGQVTQQEQYTNCATSGNWTGKVASKTSYNTNGDPINSTDADAVAGVSGHTASTGTCTGFTACLGYDSTYGTLLATGTNVLNQAGTTNYTTTSAFGFGQWPSSATDANGQVTSTTYDVLGRTLTTTLPGEGAGLTTTSTSYTVFCNPPGAQAPCLEVDQTQRLDATTTTASRSFYNGLGQLVETRTPGPSGQDVIVNTAYDVAGHTTYQSQPYFVTAYTGAPGAAAFYTPQVNGQGAFVQPGMTWQYNGIIQGTVMTEPNSATTTTTASVVCNAAGTNDTACYTSTTTVDANSHKSLGLTDALGRSIYAQDFTGNSSGTYALYRTTKQQYDVAGRTTSAIYADGSHQATATYDGLSRETAATDPDLGAWTYGYDANGNLTSSVDPRGAAGSAYAGYDGLNRVLWKSNASNGSSPFATYAYDSTASGNVGIGRLTSETFASGPSQTVTGGYTYTYDVRGRQTGWTMSLGTTNYPFQYGYNDANQQTTLTYPDGDLVTTSYDTQGWLAGVTESLSGSNKTLLNSVSYTGANGAVGEPTSATVGNSAYQWSFTYDTNLRPTDTNVKLLSNNSTLYDEQLSYDAVGNVATTNTTLPAGTDHQVFCYDEQNRLTWSGSTGTPTCGTAITAGTLPTYQQSFSYDVLDRLTQGPAGSGYTYGDSAHLNAVTSVNGYTAAYDSAGNMTCRAKNGSGQFCTPTAQHGQPMTYDALGRMLTWQSSSDSSPSTESDAYDGYGNRVQRATTPGGSSVTTTTTFVGSYEEISTTAGVTTTIKYYAAGITKVESVNGSFSYLVQDHLGSVVIEMGSSGNLRGQQLFTPYGTQRYSSGFFNSNYSFTDQYTDTNNGIDYYGARYYDPVVGQFISADTVQGPNRYGYVGGNPESFVDPSGNFACGTLVLDCLEGAAEGTAEGIGLGTLVAASPAVGLFVLSSWLLGSWIHNPAPATTSGTCYGSICATAAPTPTSGAVSGGGASNGIGALAAAAAIAALVAIRHLPPANTVSKPTSSAAVTSAQPGYVAAPPMQPLAGSKPAPTLPTTTVSPTTTISMPNIMAHYFSQDDLMQQAIDNMNHPLGSGQGGAVAVSSASNVMVHGISGLGSYLNPGIQYPGGHPYKEQCGETLCAYAAWSLLPAGAAVEIYYAQINNYEPCDGCLIAAQALATHLGAPVTIFQVLMGRNGLPYLNKKNWTKTP